MKLKIFHFFHSPFAKNQIPNEIWESTRSKEKVEAPPQYDLSEIYDK